MGIIASTEDALIAVIEQALAGRVRNVESLNGPWTASELRRALQFAPCVRLAWLGGRGSRDEDAAINARFGVYLIAGQATAEQRKRGTDRVIGIYEMIEAVAPALNEFLVPDVGTLLLDDVQPLFTEQTFALGGSVYAATFTLPNMVLPPADASAALTAFITFHADSQLDADAEPELVSEETLPQ